VKDALDQNRAPLDPFFDKSSFAIERSSAQIATEHAEFDAQVSKRIRCRKRIPQEALAQSLTAPVRQHSHKEIANMSHHLASRGWYIAPAYDVPVGYRDELWVTLFDVALNEGGRTLQGRRFEKRQILVFPSHDIEGGMETPDVLFLNLTDLNRHSSAPPNPRQRISNSTRPNGGRSSTPIRFLKAIVDIRTPLAMPIGQMP
jgi:hypothetical protein